MVRVLHSLAGTSTLWLPDLPGAIWRGSIVLLIFYRCDLPIKGALGELSDGSC